MLPVYGDVIGVRKNGRGVSSFGENSSQVERLVVVRARPIVNGSRAFWIGQIGWERSNNRINPVTFRSLTNASMRENKTPLFLYTGLAK